MPGIGIGIGTCFGGGGPFVPTKLSGCVLWLRADLGVTLNGSNVSAWADQSGNGRDLAQATTTKQPPYSTSGGPNSTPMVGPFDGVDDFLRATFTQAQPIHRWVVAIVNATPVAGETCMDGATGNTARFLSAGVTTTASINAGSSLAQSPTADISAFQICELQFNGASSSLRVGNSTAATGNAGTASPNGIILGMFGDQASAPSECSFAEVIDYDRILSAAEATTVRDYLKSRYGLDA